jgi:uncharacterized repeat protein (TIGR01451 family)
MFRRLIPVLPLLCALGVFSAPAFGETEGAGWEVTAHTFPTFLSPGENGAIEIRVINVGAANSNGTVTVTDVLPPGVKARGAGSYSNVIGKVVKNEFEYDSENRQMWDCAGNGLGGAVAGATVVTCTNDETNLPHITGGGGVPTRGSATGNPGLANGDPELGIAVEVPPGAVEGIRQDREANRVTVAGGGALGSASAVDSVMISSAAAPFGFAGKDAWFSNADGTLDTRAGSHPYEATFSFDLNNAKKGNEGYGRPAGHEPRNLTFVLPPGMIGDPAAVAQCPLSLFVTETHCPPNTEVGVVQAAIIGGTILSGPQPQAVYNLVPPPGEPAEFGFVLNGNLTLLGTKVRSGSDYGITTITDNITRAEAVSAVLTLWGEPAAPSHDPWRCEAVQGGGYTCGVSTVATHKPFFTLPTACENEAPKFSLSMSSWEDPGEAPASTSFSLHDANEGEVGFTGCEDLTFGPTLTTSPDTAAADSPAGLTVDVKPPLGGLEDTEGLSSSDIEETKVTLPAGMIINPGQAAGLQACLPGEDGLTTQLEKEHGEENDGPPDCPLASKVGTVKASSPLLESSAEKVLEGNVYVLRSNPPHLLLLAAFSADGVNVKLVLHAELNEQTGQITTTVPNIPELPVSDFKLSFSGGPQAALDTPTQCGTYTTQSDFTPWGNPFAPDVFPTAKLEITDGPGGSACPSDPMPFTPSLIAGTSNPKGGGYTSFSMLLRRGDGQQRIEKLSFTTPPGLSGMISKIPLCDEADANAGTCPKASQIGYAVVASGPGPYPLVLPQPGEPELPIYLTERYGNAPFGLSIVTPVLAGPFNLGTVVTRASIAVNPHTAQITITTNPLPQIVAGVPTDLREIDAVIDREGFMFNPTHCAPAAFSGTANSAQGAQAPISSSFDVVGCKGMAFAPKFAVSTPARTSKADGAALTATLTYPAAAQGTQANITRVKVDLPKQLPSRLTTLQKACTNAQFEANPAGCPSASVIGHARVVTPLLPVPVEGPAYFVSHGGEAFPSLIMLLQGDGVTVELVGTTFISKAGITSSTFKTVPDVPFSTFTLTLPQGRYSALAANLPVKDHGSFCGQVLTMPTAFVGQNGTEIHRSTKIGVSGCKAPKKVSKKTKKKRRAGKK